MSQVRNQGEFDISKLRLKNGNSLQNFHKNAVEHLIAEGKTKENILRELQEIDSSITYQEGDEGQTGNHLYLDHYKINEYNDLNKNILSYEKVKKFFGEHNLTDITKIKYFEKINRKSITMTELIDFEEKYDFDYNRSIEYQKQINNSASPSKEYEYYGTYPTHKELLIDSITYNDLFFTINRTTDTGIIKTIPVNLELELQINGTKYHLVCIAVKSGGIGGGHWEVITKRKSSGSEYKWYNISDENVSGGLTDEEFLKSQYYKVNCSKKGHLVLYTDTLDHLPQPKGLPNRVGVNCWFSTALQILASMTEYHKTESMYKKTFNIIKHLYETDNLLNMTSTDNSIQTLIDNMIINIPEETKVRLQEGESLDLLLYFINVLSGIKESTATKQDDPRQLISSCFEKSVIEKNTKVFAIISDENRLNALIYGDIIDYKIEKDKNGFLINTTYTVLNERNILVGDEFNPDVSVAYDEIDQVFSVTPCVRYPVPIYLYKNQRDIVFNFEIREGFSVNAAPYKAGGSRAQQERLTPKAARRLTRRQQNIRTRIDNAKVTDLYELKSVNDLPTQIQGINFNKKLEIPVHEPDHPLRLYIYDIAGKKKMIPTTGKQMLSQVKDIESHLESKNKTFYANYKIRSTDILPGNNNIELKFYLYLENQNNHEYIVIPLAYIRDKTKNTFNLSLNLKIDSENHYIFNININISDKIFTGTIQDTSKISKRNKKIFIGELKCDDYTKFIYLSDISRPEKPEDDNQSESHSEPDSDSDSEPDPEPDPDPDPEPDPEAEPEPTPNIQKTNKKSYNCYGPFLYRNSDDTPITLRQTSNEPLEKTFEKKIKSLLRDLISNIDHLRISGKMIKKNIAFIFYIQTFNIIQLKKPKTDNNITALLYDLHFNFSNLNNNFNLNKILDVLDTKTLHDSNNKNRTHRTTKSSQMKQFINSFLKEGPSMAKSTYYTNVEPVSYIIYKHLLEKNSSNTYVIKYGTKDVYADINYCIFNNNQYLHKDHKKVYYKRLDINTNSKESIISKKIEKIMMNKDIFDKFYIKCEETFRNSNNQLSVKKLKELEFIYKVLFLMSNNSDMDAYYKIKIDIILTMYKSQFKDPISYDYNLITNANKLKNNIKKTYQKL